MSAVTTAEVTASVTESPVIAEVPPAVVTVATVATADLKAALAKFVRIVPRKPRVPVLEGIRLTVENSRLSLFATDLQNSLQVWFYIDSFAAGAVITDYKALTAAVKGIKTDRLVLSIHDQKVIVEDAAGGIKATCWATGGTGDYPEPAKLRTFDSAFAGVLAGMKKTTSEHLQKGAAWDSLLESNRRELAAKFRELNVSGPYLAEGMRFTLPGVAVGETRYALNGIHLGSGRGGEIELAASNTHVLYAQRVQQLSGDKLGDAGFILLPSACEWLAKHAAAEVTGIRIQTDDIDVFFTGNNWILCTRQIDGMFPRYHDVMPAGDALPGNLKVNRKALLDALKTASVHCNTETRRIDLLPANDGEALEVRAVRDGMTEFSTTIPAASRKCRPAIFNVDFLIDFLATYTGDAVTFRYDANFKCDGPTAVFDADREFVVMPLNYGRDSMTKDEKAEHGRMIEAYKAALAGPDQDFPGETSPVSLPTAKKAPSFKAVVAYAKADPGYLSSLLAALGIQAAAV